MSICWSNIVDELFRRLEELALVCPSCTNATPCVNDVTRTPPMDLKILSECCACILGNVLETIQNVSRMYTSAGAEEDVAIYKLGDVIVEITSTHAIVVPLSKLESYLELLGDAEYRNADTIMQWLKESGAPAQCSSEM